nr:MAG TPA: hypothetical protein [Caudoviricetes sp.]
MSIGSRFEAFLSLFVENGLVGNVEIPRFWGRAPSPHSGLAPQRYSEIPPRYFGLRPRKLVGGPERSAGGYVGCLRGM